MAPDDSLGGEELVGRDDGVPVHAQLAGEVACRGQPSSVLEPAVRQRIADPVRDLAVDGDSAVEVDLQAGDTHEGFYWSRPIGSVAYVGPRIK